MGHSILEVKKVSGFGRILTIDMAYKYYSAKVKIDITLLSVEDAQLLVDMFGGGYVGDERWSFTHIKDLNKFEKLITKFNGSIIHIYGH